MQGTQFSLFEIVRRRWQTFLFTSTAISLFVAFGYLLQPLRYNVSGIYQPQKVEPRKRSVPSSSDLLEQLEFLDNFLDQFFRNDSELSPESKLIKDDENLQRTIQTLKIKDHEGNPASPRSLRRRIRLSAHNKGNAVNISMDDADPEQAKQIINQLMTLYVERFAPESQTESVNFKTVLQPHLVNAETLEKQAKQALYQIQLGTKQTPLAPAEKAGDQTLELQSIRISVAQQLSTIDEEIELLQQEMSIETNERKTLLQSVIELSTVRKQVLEQLSGILERSREDAELGNLLNILENKILDLKKNLILTQNLYTTFLERQQTPWAFNSTRKKNTIQIIRPAQVPAQGKRPFLSWFLALGALASLSAGTLASLMVERRDHSFLSLSDLYHHLKLPIFGVIPHFSSKALAIQSLARQDGTEFQEFTTLTNAYAQIIRGFEIASLDRIPQVLAFTSAGCNEGKSLTVANLAYAFSRKGKKTLLIEADLFRPSQYQYWNIAQSAGLCDCIAGKIQLGKALQRLHPNLDLLQGGQVQKNKDIVLNSPGMTLLIKEFKSRYDHILVDTPALSDSVHGYLLANCADATLLVTRPSYINKVQIFNMQETVNRTDHRLWGMVINDAKQNSHSSRVRKLIQDSQWDATIRLQKTVKGDSLELSTLSAINKADEESSSEDAIHGDLHHMDATVATRREKQEVYLYNLPLEELRKLVDSLWESWSHDIEVLLDQEEEVVQQSRLVRELQEKVERGNPYLKLSSELQLKEEKEKLNLLADTYIGQRPTLMGDREDLEFYLEILFARTDAECIPSAQS